jgi:hypothetical protein
VVKMLFISVAQFYICDLGDGVHGVGGEFIISSDNSWYVQLISLR